MFLTAVFCKEQLKNVSRVFFTMFLRILNFDPNWQFCKGYSPCIVAKFGHDGKVSIFLILGVFDSRCLHRTVSRVFFSMILRILNFDPNWQFCKGYSLCIVAKFGHDGKVAIFQILGVFDSRFLHRTVSRVLEKLL